MGSKGFNSCALVILMARLIWCELPAHLANSQPRPLSLDSVHFDVHSELHASASMDFAFVRSLAPEDLVWVYARNTNITLAPEYQGFTGGWEDPRGSARNIAGQFTGHWMSAASRFVNNTGDKMTCLFHALNAGISSHVSIAIFELLNQIYWRDFDNRPQRK
jgi:hypothetical protein